MNDSAREELNDWLGGSDADIALSNPATGRSLTYAELRECVEAVAWQLFAAGARPGSVVALSLPNGPETIVAFLAVVANGAAAAPLNPTSTGEEVARYLAELGPALVVVDRSTSTATLAAATGSGATVVSLNAEPRLDKGASDAPLPAADPDAVALLLQTSGTTGRPKIVPLRQRNLLASARAVARHYSLGPTDVSHCVMPLFHVHGLVASTLAPFVSGGGVIAPSRFSAGAFWAEGSTFGATWYSAVPTIHQILLARADADGPPEHGLRFARSCSATLPPAVMQAFEHVFEIPLVEAYGMTEAAHQMASNPLPPGERKPASVGVSAGAELQIVDSSWTPLATGVVGEVTVRGHGVIDGYLGNPEANATSLRDGWFRTGDSGSLDADGYLHLDGRIKELINRGGEKISPHEVEEVLLRHPSVAEAVAFAAADAKYGEVVEAAVVLRSPAAESALRRHCADYLSEFKVPRRITILDQIPKSPTGKIQRRLLAELVGGR